jgi:hypothetical protein
MSVRSTGTASAVVSAVVGAVLTTMWARHASDLFGFLLRHRAVRNRHLDRFGNLGFDLGALRTHFSGACVSDLVLDNPRLHPRAGVRQARGHMLLKLRSGHRKVVLGLAVLGFLSHGGGRYKHGESENDGCNHVLHGIYLWTLGFDSAPARAGVLH